MFFITFSEIQEIKENDKNSENKEIKENDKNSENQEIKENQEINLLILLNPVCIVVIFAAIFIPMFI